MKKEIAENLIFEYKKNKSRYTSIDYRGIFKEIHHVFPIRKQGICPGIDGYMITRQKHNIFLIPKSGDNEIKLSEIGDNKIKPSKPQKMSCV